MLTADRPLTFREAAQAANVSESTIKREVAAGRLPVTGARGCVRILASDLAAYLQKNRHTVCRSDVTERDGKSAFSMAGSDLAKLLGIAKTLSPLNEDGENESQITRLDEYRATHSKKPSRAG